MPATMKQENHAHGKNSDPIKTEHSCRCNQPGFVGDCHNIYFPTSMSESVHDVSSTWAMLIAHFSISFQSRKSPSGNKLRAAGNLRNIL